LPFRPVKDRGREVAADRLADYMMAALGRRTWTAKMLEPVLNLISAVIEIYIWLLIGSAVLSWLVAFNVVNTRNQFVVTAIDVLYRLTEPVLAPLRRILPNFGGLDISPVVVILILIFVRQELWVLYYKYG
jgi:YggT family protein